MNRKIDLSLFLCCCVGKLLSDELESMIIHLFTSLIH